MKITAIRGYHLAYDLPEPVRNAVSRFESRSALVVEIVGAGGLSGWGECTEYPAVTWEFLHRTLAARLLGQDPRHGHALWRSMLETGGAGQIAMMAISAVDMALWDLRGRIEGVSIARLLGGALRERVLPYASGPFMKPGGDPYRDFPADIDRYLAAGFRAVKPRSGTDPRSDAKMARDLRARLGPDRALMLDFNRGYARPAALEAIQLVAEAGVLWIEEPIAPDDLDGYRMLAARTGATIAAGEALCSLAQFHALLQTQAIGVLQPDLYLCGGLTGALRIASLAEAHGTPYCPHVWGTAINFHASLHLAAVLPAARLADGTALPMLEWDQSDNALLRIAPAPAIGRDGMIAVPDAPGIGVAIEPHRFGPYLRESWQVSA